MNRREFLSWAGVGWLAASLPVAMAACAPSAPSSQSAASPESESGSPAPESTSESAAGATEAAPEVALVDGFAPVGTVAELDAQGFLKLMEPEEAIVIRDPADTTQIVALTSICNHRNCVVDWKANDREFLCPCHDSRFGPDGTLVEGPATAGLTPLEVKVEGETILVKVA